jgi:hypothetical protein
MIELSKLTKANTDLRKNEIVWIFNDLLENSGVEK